MRVVNFKKTNKSGDENAAKVEYQGEIEFLTDGVWTKGGRMDTHVFYKVSPPQPSMGGFGGIVMKDITGNSPVQKGKRHTINDYAIFEKTEQGWKADDGQLY